MGILLEVRTGGGTSHNALEQGLLGVFWVLVALAVATLAAAGLIVYLRRIREGSAAT
jgi:hypothetical protein